MEDTTKSIESLFEIATDFGKTNFKLVKLKVVDKTSDRISSFVSKTIVLIILGTFMLFLNLGMALWIGEILGKFYFGFFTVAVFYALIAFVIHFFMRKWLKRVIYDYIIKQFLK